MMRMFVEKSILPNAKALAAALGKTYAYWEEIQQTLNNRYGKLNPEWKYYGATSGWTLKMLLNGRNLFFFAPYDKCFLIAFTFGDKAVKVIEQSDLPCEIIEEIKKAKKYAEGRGLRIEVHTREQIQHILKLADIKVHN